MRVFAPAAFRYPAGPSGTDYPYGWQDLPQSLADTLTAAGYLVGDKPDGGDLKPGEGVLKYKTTSDGGVDNEGSPAYGNFLINGQNSYWSPGSCAKHDYLLGQIQQSRGGVIGTNGLPVVAFRCDHGTQQFLDFYAKMFEDRGLPVTLGVVTSAIGSTNNPYETCTYSWADLKTFVDKGVEIWAHTHTHRDPVITGLDIDQEVLQPKKLIEAANIKCVGWHTGGISGCQYPHFSGRFKNPDSWDSDYGGAIWSNYGLIEMYSGQGAAYRKLPTNGLADMGHYTLDPLTYATAISSLDNAVKRGLSIFYMWHPKFVELGNTVWTRANMALFLDEIAARRAAGKIEVLSASGMHFADQSSNQRLDLIIDGKVLEQTTFTSATTPWTRGGNMSNTLTVSSGGPKGSNIITFPGGSTYYTNVYQGYAGLDNLRLKGAIMMAECDVRCSGSATELSVNVTCDAGAKLNLARYYNQPADNTWRHIYFPVVIPPDASTVGTYFGRRIGTGQIDIANMMFRPV